jgi:predicted solute-binding protein
MVTREAVERKAAEVRTLVTQLLAAKELAYDSYAAIAGKSAEREWMGERGLVDYWQAISYDLTPRHLEGAATFFRYALELQLLAAEPEIRLVR